jgi:hypothetical protein
LPFKVGNLSEFIEVEDFLISQAILSVPCDVHAMDVAMKTLKKKTVLF